MGDLALLRDAWIEYQRDRARYLAVAIIYYAAVCLVPMALLLLATLRLLLRYSMTAAYLERQTLAGIQTRFGSQASAMITRLLEGLQRDSMVVTIIGVVGMLVGASLLFRQLRLTFRAVSHYEPPSIAGPIRFRVFMIIREWVIAFVIGTRHRLRVPVARAHSRQSDDSSRNRSARPLADVGEYWRASAVLWRGAMQGRDSTGQSRQRLSIANHGLRSGALRCRFVHE